jgi:HlyD family secretion protein
VRFTVDAYPNQVFKGEVGQIRLNATMTQNVVTYTVVVNTPNPDGKLLPYLTANLLFEVTQRESVLLVPNSALRWQPAPAMVAPDVRDAFIKAQRAKDLPANEKAADLDHASRGTVWVQDGSFVRPVEVHVGLTDGSQTEIVSGDLKERTPIVTGIVPRGDDSAQGGASPFAPQLFGGKKS